MNTNKIERAKKEYTKFNENLKYFREKNGYTAKELSQLIGIPNNTYTAYETKNREPSFAVLIKIANALNVTIDELLDNKQSKLNNALSFCKQHGYSIVPSKKMLEIYKRNFPNENIALSPNEVPLIQDDYLKPLLNDKKITIGFISDPQGNSTDLPDVIDPKSQIIHINNEDLIKLVQSIMDNKALHIQLNDILTSKLMEYQQKDLVESGMRSLDNFRKKLDDKYVDSQMIKYIDRVLENWKIAKNKHD
jgi:transcriptional regulator with XRE-family HTH domain